jgi:hypothetical protein
MGIGTSEIRFNASYSRSPLIRGKNLLNFKKSRLEESVSNTKTFASLCEPISWLTQCCKGSFDCHLPRTQITAWGRIRFFTGNLMA